MLNEKKYLENRIAGFFIFLLIFTLFSRVNALEIFGYYENTLIQEYNDSGYDDLKNASKLRINFESVLDDELHFISNVILISHHLNPIYDLGSYLPQTVVEDLIQNGFPTDLEMEKNRIFLDNAYLTWRLSVLRLRAGRQQLSWGSGYSFNPTDLFHRKDMVDPTYEKEGVNAVRFDYNWGIGGNLSGIIVPGRKFSSSGYALRLGTHFSKYGYDVGLTIHEVDDTTSIDASTFEIVTQNRSAFGLDINGTLFEMGIWMEGNFNVMEKENDFSRIVTGIDYTLENGIYLIIECLYDGRSDNSKSYKTKDWMEYIQSGEPISRYRFMAGARQMLFELVEGGVYVFGGTDGSFLFNPRFDISIAQNADLTLFGAASFGDAEGQFSSGGYSAIARISVFF